MKHDVMVPVCLPRDEMKLLEDFGRSKGMLNLKQTIEYLLNPRK